MENQKNSSCCPQLVDGKKCDYLDFVYRLKHFTDVASERQQQRVAVEVALHVRIERCTGPLQLGNVVYSTTLLPGEKVKLFTQDQRSRFSFDSETQLSYRHEQSSEEQFYMESFEKFMSDLDSREEISDNSTSSGSSSNTASTSGLFGTIFNGPSASIKGSFNASSSRDFLRELRVHSEASHNKSIQMTRETSAVQVGEVQSRTHVEGESESHFESSSRTFSNSNRCHSISYLFYQLDKQQTTKVSIRTINLRVIDPAVNTAVSNNPILTKPKFSIIPSAVLATSDKGIEKIKEANSLTNQRILAAQPRFSFQALQVQATPFSQKIRDEALKNVTDDLIKNKVIEKDGSPTKEVSAEFNFEFKTTIPTPGIVVRGCLDECNTCEDAQKQLITLEIEGKKLQNKLLERQIELLDKSQEYRCCPEPLLVESDGE